LASERKWTDHPSGGENDKGRGGLGGIEMGGAPIREGGRRWRRLLRKGTGDAGEKKAWLEGRGGIWGGLAGKPQTKRRGGKGHSRRRPVPPLNNPRRTVRVKVKIWGTEKNAPEQDSRATSHGKLSLAKGRAGAGTVGGCKGVDVNSTKGGN